MGSRPKDKPMTKPTSAQCSKEHVLTNLTRIRAATNPHFKSDELARLAMAVFQDELQVYPPQAITDGCNQWIKTRAKWPAPSELIAFIEANLVTPKSIEDKSDFGSVTRNEAILLLSMFNFEAKDYLECPSGAWCEFIAEAGRVWAKVRPEGGLAEADRLRQRSTYGFALEAWARWYLRVKPVHSAYITPATREIHRLMTGRELETHDEPALAAVGSLAAAMANVVQPRAPE